MNLLKKGSLGIISFVGMLVIVGFINYEYNAEREANLGQSIYVISKEGEIIEKDSNNIGNKNEYIYASSNFDIKKIKEELELFKEEIGDIDLNSVKFYYDFNSNKYKIILPKILESKEEIILGYLSKYISIEKIVLQYE